MLVPVHRFPRWVSNFESRHGTTTLVVEGGALRGAASDGSIFRAAQPFATSYDGKADAADFARSVQPPADWGVLLVRKGGFAVARLQDAQITDSKVGQRHVQGRTKAGGQSQQRFARRRDNQARAAYQAAGDHAARILAGLGPVIVGGDRPAVDEVMTDTRLAALQVRPPWLTVPDPRRAVLNQAILDAQSIVVEVTNAQSP